MDKAISVVIYLNESKLCSQLEEISSMIADKFREIMQTEMQRREFICGLDGASTVLVDQHDEEEEEHDAHLATRDFNAPILVVPVIDLPKEALVELEVVSLVDAAQRGYCPEIIYESTISDSPQLTMTSIDIEQFSNVDVLSWPIFGSLTPLPKAHLTNYPQVKEYTLSTQLAYHSQLFISGVTVVSSKMGRVNIDVLRMVDILKTFKLHMLDRIRFADVDIRAVTGVKIWFLSDLTGEYSDYLVAAKDVFADLLINSVSLIPASIGHISGLSTSSEKSSLPYEVIKISFLAIDLLKFRTESWIRGG